MRRLIFATTAVFALAGIGSASAADMAFKAPPPPPWYDWTGFYVGLNGGGSWGRSDTYYTGGLNTGAVIPPFTTRTNLDGWLGGAQAGYNWQTGRNWLIGVEADIQGTGERGSANAPTFVIAPPAVIVAALPTTFATGNLAQKLPWFGTARLRLGYEPSDHWLLYVTGGFAFGELRSVGTASAFTAFPGGPVLAAAAVSSSINNDLSGWTIGGGTEWKLTERWSAKLEYLYIDYGHVTDTFIFGGLPLPGLATITTNSHVTDNILRVGLNYHFGGPVVTRD